MTFAPKVELAKAVIPLLVVSLVLVAVAATSLFGALVRRTSQLERAQADLKRLKRQVAVYEQINDLRAESIRAMQRVGR